MKRLPLFLYPQLIFFFLVTLFFSSCYYDNLEELHPVLTNLNCDTVGTVSYATDIVPILSSNCGINNTCHNNTSFYRLDTYSGVHDRASSGLLVKAIKHDPSLAAVDFMPSGGGVLDSCSIKKIEAWVNRGISNN